MKLYINELAPWERKNEYFHHIQLGKDVESQTTILHDAINNQTQAQLASASAIIASKERIADDIGELSLGIDRIEQGIESLKASFEWGISEVVWQLEQNRKVLKSILEVLMTPLDTQARERRKRAENAYSNGWIDDAEEEFLESEKLNRYDFAIHLSLGMIYLFHKIDKNKALEYLEKAIKYARPESDYYTSYTLLYKALIMRDFGKLEEAEKCTNEAIKISPNISEAFYQNAQYNALLNRPEKAIKMLEIAITNDVNYCEKCHNDPTFDNIRSNVFGLFKQLRKREGDEAQSKYSKITQRYKKLNNTVDSLRKEFDIKPLNKEVLSLFHRTKKLIDRNSYRDYLEANSLLDEAKDKVQKLHNDTLKNIDYKISSLESKISRIKSSHNDHYRESEGTLVKIWFIAIPLGIILGLRGCFSELEKDYGTGSGILAGIGALFSIPFKILLFTLILYLVFKFILKTNKKNQPEEINSLKEEIMILREKSDLVKFYRKTD
ncbi:tetratricopeptide repeat protein [Desulfotignum phosphitoxidans]|uniref:TPR repeat-containing protein n=1 Tax=Desulfotignum phosphitoxidans DSM 13687 TaxID=1286635 RepID=S0FZX4_9BACT|nr:hypothetical protein [Desulfotignum phosphitoxidans]EMS77542.1 TPR repeat-containing protein [Desulfotignum phosphitoxidans DSM 13687]